jgi:hypothetical protein
MFRFVLSLLLLADPQIVCMLGTENPPYNAYSDQSSSADALELAGKVNAALVSSCVPNCPRISMFRNSTAPNLMLARASNQVKLVYKPEFFTKVYESAGDAGVLALLAHEVGHAIDGAGQVTWMKSSWSPELRADAWAGCALARMKLSTRNVQAGFDTLANYPSGSHPDWKTRLTVLQSGYAECGGK